MIRSFVYTVAFVLLGMGMTGCEAVGPEKIQTGKRTVVHSGLEIVLRAPEAVSVGQDFEAQYEIRNRRSEAVTLRTSNSCITHFGVGIFRDGERVPMKGTNLGCLAVISHHDLAAGDTLKRSYDLQAKMAEGEDGSVQPGTYVLRAESNVGTIDGEEETLPTVEKELEVVQ